MSQRESIQPHSVSGNPSLQDQADLLRGFRDGFQAVHVITTGEQTGLFERLAAHPEGITYQELAQETGYHAPYLRVWCSTAYRFYLLETEEDGRYRLAPHMGSLLADRSNPASMIRTLTSAVTQQGPRMACYDEIIKTGEEGSHADAYGRNPERRDPPRSQEVLTRWMWLERVLPKVPELEGILRGGGRLLDIGCGPGLLLLQLADLYPSVQLVGVDVVEVGGLETARRLINERGFEARVSVNMVRADEMTFQQEFDAVTMTSVFHEILPVSLRETVFGACYRALKHPGVLIIRDSPYPSTLADFRDSRYWPGVWGQYLEMSWGTIHPTWEERQNWLTNVGFKTVDHHFITGMPQGTAYLDIAHKL